MPRTFTGYASAYAANQLTQTLVRRKQVRSVVVDFNGALPVGETIVAVTWEAVSPWITFMYDAAIGLTERSVSVKVLFNYAGFGNIKATATTDTGDILNYEFCFAVKDTPIYPSETFTSAEGPYSLTVP